MEDVGIGSKMYNHKHVQISIHSADDSGALLYSTFIVWIINKIKKTVYIVCPSFKCSATYQLSLHTFGFSRFH